MGIEVAKVIKEWRSRQGEKNTSLRAAAEILSEKVFPISATAIDNWETGKDMPRHAFIKLMRVSSDPEMAALGEKLEAARALDLQSSDSLPSPAEPAEPEQGDDDPSMPTD